MPIQTTGNGDIDTATAEIAVALRNASSALCTDQYYYDEAVRLRNAIMAGTRNLDEFNRFGTAPGYPQDSRDPGWFREFMEHGCKDEPAGLVPGGGAEVSNDGSFDYRERT